MTVSDFFTKLYDFFHGKKWLLFLLLGIWASFCGFVLSQIRFEDDISNVFPDDPLVQDANTILNKSPFLKRIYMVVKPADTNQINTERIMHAADLVTEKIQQHAAGYLYKVNCRAEDEMATRIMEMVHNNIPYFLDSVGYSEIENNLHPDSIHNLFEEGYNQLLSPVGFATKSFFVNDPLGMVWKGMKKLNVLNTNERFTINDGYIMTRDGHNLMIFIEPSNTSANANQKLVEVIDNSIAEVNGIYPDLDIIYFGAPAMSVANAKQIRKDVFLTVGLAFILLNIIVLVYFRKWYAMPLLMAPVFFGTATSLTVLVLTRQVISSISLGIGSVMLGLILDFSLHAYTHFRENKSARQMVAEISPLLMATSGTTVLAFLCLLALRSNLLYELGLFAAINVGTAALFTVIVLPHFMGKPPHTMKRYNKKKRKIALAGKVKWISLIMTVFLVVPLFFVRKVHFEAEMDKLSYMPDNLRDAENYLDEISDFKLKNIYVVSKGKNFQEALEDQQKYQEKLEILKQKNLIESYTSIAQFWPSESVKKNSLDKWNTFWTEERKEIVRISIEEEASIHKFKPNVFDGFYAWINQPRVYSDDEALDLINHLFLGDLIQTSDGEVRLISLIRVSEAKKPMVYASFSQSDFVFDNKFIFNKLEQIIRQDFQLLVWLSTILVFGIILLTFRKTELALVMMVPLILSWLVTLGIMGMIGQQLNILNIIICTFIFGLGIDYSIFLGKGIIDQYRNITSSLPTFRISIILSLATTLLGMGVLIFAQHPALKSIAIISLIGLFSLAIIEFFLLPSIINFLLYSSKKPRRVVISLKNILITISLLVTYVVCGIFLFAFGLIIRLFPKGHLILEKQFSFCMKIVLYVAVSFQQRNVFNIDPSQFKNTILIMNHQSMIDLVLLGAISGKIRVVTKNWVLKFPVLGNVARMLGFYSLDDAAKPVFIDRMKKDLENGYTVMFFPEGSRSKDQSIQRFKKGIFLLAEQSGIDITPLIITGTGSAMPPGTLFITSGLCAVKVLPRISIHHENYSSNYITRTKEVCQMMREEHHIFRTEVENKRYIKNAIEPRYRYRSPEVRRNYYFLLERFENFSVLNKQFSYNETIGFAGANYGALISYLMFSGPLRTLVVYETNPEKIAELNFIRNWHPSIKITDKIQDIMISQILIVQGMIDNEAFYRLAKSLGPKELFVMHDASLPTDMEKWKVIKQNENYRLIQYGIL